METKNILQNLLYITKPEEYDDGFIEYLQDVFGNFHYDLAFTKECAYRHIDGKSKEQELRRGEELVYDTVPYNLVILNGLAIPSDYSLAQDNSPGPMNIDGVHSLGNIVYSDCRNRTHLDDSGLIDFCSLTDYHDAYDIHENGVSIVSYIKSNDWCKVAHIPVLVLTNAPNEFKERAFERGADMVLNKYLSSSRTGKLYHEKGVTIQTVIKRIEELMSFQ